MKSRVGTGRELLTAQKTDASAPDQEAEEHEHICRTFPHDKARRRQEKMAGIHRDGVRNTGLNLRAVWGGSQHKYHTCRAFLQYECGSECVDYNSG